MAAGTARRYAAFLLRAPLRHRRLSLGAVLLLAALGAGALQVVPIRWEVRATILSQPGTLMGSLSTPGAAAEWDAPALTIREVLTRRSNVLAICKRTSFVERYLASRAPAVRARDWLVATLTGATRTSDELQEALADTLQEQLRVTADPTGTITISFAWPDKDLALQIVEAAVQSFMDDTHANELKMVAETVAILEKHDERVQREMESTLQQLGEKQRKLGSERLSASTPALRSYEGRDQEVARLEASLGTRRRAMADLEEFRVRRAQELQVQLDRQLIVYAPDHPLVGSTRKALESSASPSAQAQALRREVHDLEREVIGRGGRVAGGGLAGAAFQGSLSLSDRLRLDARDPRLEYERRHLDLLLREHTHLLERITTARMKMTVAPPAFKYRYSVIAPARLPRSPMKPYALLFLGGGLLGGLALAMFLSLAEDVRAGQVTVGWEEGQGLHPELWTGAAAPPVPLERLTRPRPGYLALLVGVSLATAAVVVAGGGPLLAVAPSALAGLAWFMTRIPLRWSVTVLLFLVLGLDNTAETTGQWRTPLAILGSLLQDRIDEVASVPGLAVTGLELVVVFLLAIWAQRRATGSALDAGGRFPTSSILPRLLLLTVGAVLFAEVVGLVHGQSLVPWKVRNFIHPVLLFMVFDAAFRGPIDHRLIGRVVVAAAVTRAVLAVIVQRLAIAETGGKWAVATSHGDSILLATGAFLLLADLTERADGRKLLRAGLLLPILAAGMLENGRRLVWVMMVMMLLVTYLVSPMTGWKRRITRGALVLVPLLALYVGVGWTSEARIFAPIKTLRGVTDTSYDHSAYWREVENWNIAMSMRDRPFLGQGLGGSYTEHMANDDISGLYREYREWPHNTVLGQLLLLGLFGFTAVWSLFAAGLYLAYRSFASATEPGDRVAALGCVGALIACHMMGYGDTGAHYTQYKVLAALALAVAGKLAVSTGAWPRRRTSA